MRNRMSGPPASSRSQALCLVTPPDALAINLRWRPRDLRHPLLAELASTSLSNATSAGLRSTRAPVPERLQGVHKSWVHSGDHPTETGRQLNFVGRLYPPTPAALFRLFSGPKRRARPDPQGPRANHLLRATGPHPRRSRHFRRGPGSAPRRKPPKNRAFSPAPRSSRSIRWPATITRSTACGVNAWRSPTRPRSRATPGGPRTRRRCDRPPPA